MNFVQKILKKINGLAYAQEYLCMGEDDITHPLHVYITNGENKIVYDAAGRHAMTGYHPLILAFSGNQPFFGDTIRLCFSQKEYDTGCVLPKKNILAWLTLSRLHQKTLEGTSLHFYKATRGHHDFINPFHRLINRLDNSLFNRKPYNVYLTNRIYTTVQIGYAVPRKISLVTVGRAEQYNLFPTDLHGEFEGYYIISLRKTGRACSQVQENKNILLCDMDPSYYKQVYGLGKNHMQELKPSTSFQFTATHSPTFNLPVPEGAVTCKELELIDYFSHDIHTLLLFKIVSTRPITGKGNTLHHLHTTYATWRKKNRLPGKYLLR